MARSQLQVPDFDYTGFYYGQILVAIMQHLRDNVSEINTENPADPAVQLLRAFALVGHLNNVRLDMVAHETLFSTAQLRDSVVAHLKLIGFEVAGDVPAKVSLLCKLSKVLTADTLAVPNGALFGTKRTSSAEPLVFEADGELYVDRTDQVSKAWVNDHSIPSFVDVTTQANTSGSTWTLFPGSPQPRDAFYVGHSTTLTNRLRITGMTTPMSNIVAMWEYYDGELEDAAPDVVTNLGGTLKIIIDSMLDTDGSVSYEGLDVQVMLNDTGAAEMLVSEHDGANNYVTTTGFLGQASPSTSVSDYTVGTNWHRVPGLDDNTNDGNNTLELNGNIDFPVPKDMDEDWNKCEINGVEAYWLRLRIISVLGPVAPVIDRVYWHKRDNYVCVACTQGRTRSDVNLATSDGSANQSYALTYSPVIPNSMTATVDAEVWTEVQSFLNSNSIDQHYVLTVDTDGIGTLLFGDSINGKAPNSGSIIAATYRTEAAYDGNVASRSIVQNRSGLGNLKEVYNPRQATGWAARRGSTPEDIERLKLEGPASLRVLGRAVSPGDIEYLATTWKDVQYGGLFVRARAVEGGYGPKTIKLIVVGKSSTITSPVARSALDIYFNGDPATGDSGIIVANQRVTTVDYTPKVIHIVATVTGGAKSTIETALVGLIHPLALMSDGITYRWEYGATITRAKLISAICSSDPNISDVTMSSPSANVTLQGDELPSLGTLSITVI